jgi:peptide/nickel transport system permease protein
MMVSIEPVILWTDALVFALLGFVVLFVAWSRRQEHLRAPWRKVARSPSGMVAATILAFFVLTGLLDSLHDREPSSAARPSGARASGEVLSALDALAAPLRQGVERTFSAPFSAYGHSRETVNRPDGTQTREFPRLRHGGAHLRDPAQERLPDILRGVLRGVALAAVLWSLLSAGLTFAAARSTGGTFAEASRAIWEGSHPIPLRAVLVSLGAVLLFIGPMIVLAGKYHVLGTDKVGQDVFYLTLKSIRTGLVIGTVTTLVMLPFALALGIMAGYFRGWVDDAIQYLYTTLSSIPGVLLIAAAVLMMQVYMDSHAETFDSITRRADFRLLFLCVILGLTSWTGLCRLLRGETLKLREMDYIQAARALGASPWRIMLDHVLPNVLHLVIITTVLGFSGLVLAEAVLSYVGVGVDPAMNSFGTMINAARLEMAREPVVWWSLASAFAFMFVLVLAANLFADAVRDAMDPRAFPAAPVRVARRRAGIRRPAADGGGRA